jgi:hypothetical protein
MKNAQLTSQLKSASACLNVGGTFVARLFARTDAHAEAYVDKSRRSRRIVERMTASCAYRAIASTSFGSGESRSTVSSMVTSKS